MPLMHVVTPFQVTLEPINEDGTPRDPSLPSTYVFPQTGYYDMTDEVANHWYVQPHLEGYEPAAEGEIVVMVPEEPPPPPEGGEGEGGITTQRRESENRENREARDREHRERQAQAQDQARRGKAE